jgi:hypothetical protein
MKSRSKKLCDNQSSKLFVEIVSFRQSHVGTELYVGKLLENFLRRESDFHSSSTFCLRLISMETLTKLAVYAENVRDYVFSLIQGDTMKTWAFFQNFSLAPFNKYEDCHQICVSRRKCTRLSVQVDFRATS